MWGILHPHVVTAGSAQLWNALLRTVQADTITLPLLSIIFLGSMLSSTVGFAYSALVGAAIFHVVPDPVVAVEVMMISSIALQLYSVAALWRQISWARCLPFLIGGLLTTPVGLYLLLHLPAGHYINGVGVALVFYGAYMLFRPDVRIKERGRWSNFAIGMLGGITGPMAAFPGMFITIWCSLMDWNKTTQRAVFQPYILVMQIVSLSALLWLHDLSLSGVQLALYAGPAVAGACIGLCIFRKLSDGQFQRLVIVALIGSGVALAFK